MNQGNDGLCAIFDGFSQVLSKVKMILMLYNVVTVVFVFFQ